jgi:folylpolyglutamate synthase
LTSVAAATAGGDPLSVQKSLAETFASLTSQKAEVHVLPHIQAAADAVATIAKQDGVEGVDILVTGSLHLVGGVMEVAQLPVA